MADYLFTWLLQPMLLDGMRKPEWVSFHHWIGRFHYVYRIILPLFMRNFLLFSLPSGNLTQCSLQWCFSPTPFPCACLLPQKLPLLSSKLFILAFPLVREIWLVWLPGHCGLHLNEAANMLAKMALAFPVAKLYFPHLLACCWPVISNTCWPKVPLIMGCARLPSLNTSGFAGKVFCQTRLCEVSRPFAVLSPPLISTYIRLI